MGVSPSRFDVCARCGEPCEADDLVCNRCSETRIRATLPAEGLPPSVEEGSLDDKLARIEERTGERAHHVVASIEGTLGGNVTVHISIVPAPMGPETPAEDVWSDPVEVTTLECGSSEVAAARMNWIDRITQERKLAAPEISRRFRVGTRGYRGEPDAVGMLLDARLHMARRALEPRGSGAPLDGSETVERACTLEVDTSSSSQGTLRVIADFTSKGEIELFSERSTPELRHAVEAWIGSSRAEPSNET
ncbi:MAG TPA: hypothetical protein VH054_00510 [Polyangiaceae bacterium]|nr:hypothetical protein [Polyangiaceae bacterium]